MDNPTRLSRLLLRSLRGLLESLLDRGLREYLLDRGLREYLDERGLLVRRKGLLSRLCLGLGLLSGGSILALWLGCILSRRSRYGPDLLLGDLLDALSGLTLLGLFERRLAVSALRGLLE